MTEWKVVFIAIGLLALIQSTEMIDWLCDKIADSFNKKKQDNK